MRARHGSQRVRGHTLIELLVVLAILGVVAGVAGLSFRRPAPVTTASRAAALVAEARRRAIHDGRSITITVQHDGRAHAVTARPDGSVLADSVLAVDRLTGRVEQ